MSDASDRTARGLAVLGSALGFGLAADVLGHAVPGRLSVALGLVALLLAAGAPVARGILRAPAVLAPLGIPFGLLAVALIWRDSATLFALNLGGIALLASFGAPRIRGVGGRRSGLADYAAAGTELVGGAATGAAPLLAEVEWRALPSAGPLHHMRGVLVGLAAATPVAALFGSLLSEADPIFDRLLAGALGGRLDQVVEHGATVLLWTWLAAGLLRVMLLRPAGPAAPVRPAGRFSLTEVGTMLLVVNGLFLAFVLVQLRYLFTGAELVRSVTGLSYAEYARQGFFQLVAVAALSLPLLLVGDWALGHRDRASLRRFRLLAAVMLLLLNVMLASALWRMRLYTLEYGLTELRFYTTAFMGWLVLVLGWFGATVLRDRRERFGFGAAAAGLFVLGGLNLVNPDGLIAATNLARAGRERPIDSAYLSGLSADALPVLRRTLPSLAPAERCAVAGLLRDRWAPELSRRERWTIAFAQASRLPPVPPAYCPAAPRR